MAILHTLTAAIATLSIHVAHAAPPCQPERHVQIPSLHKVNYHQARARLISAGWFPVQTKPRGVNPNDDPDLAFGNGRSFWDRGYLEVEGCSNTGFSSCAFRWTDKYGNQVRIATRGEETPEKNIHAMATGGKFLCPGEE
jgi:hypothetical protein